MGLHRLATSMSLLPQREQVMSGGASGQWQVRRKRRPLGKTSRTFRGNSGGETAGGGRRKAQFVRSREKTQVWRFLRLHHESPRDPTTPLLDRDSHRCARERTQQR